MADNSVAHIQVTLAASQLTVGQTTQASAKLSNGANVVLTGKQVAWSSSNPAVASVNASSGAISAVTAGSATISATSDSIVGSAALTVVAPNAPSTHDVVVSLGSGSIFVGAKTQAAAITKDSSGNVLTGRSIAWSSSNTSVATVDAASGNVSGVNPGTSVIRATSDGITGSASLTVLAVPIASVSVTLGGSNLMVGTTAQATAIAKDSAGNPLTGRTITWSSSNTAVATVASNGVVTAVATGTSTIKATSEGVNGSATLTVVAVPVSSVTATLASSNLTVGATTQATAVTKDSAGNVLASRTVTWSSSNTGVATVASNGVVTAVGVGSSTITATSEGKTGSASLAVAAKPVATVSVTLANSNLTTGGTTQATAVTKDSAGGVLTGRTVTWSSSNTAVATVASNGTVTAVAPGSSTISAMSEGKTGSASLTVTAPVVVATQLAIITQPPTSVQSGTALSPATVVQLRSASNAPVSQSGVVVTASVASGSATLSGTLTATTNSSGAATFSALTLNGSGATTLRFSATGLTAATSSSITVNASTGSNPTVLIDEKFEDSNLSGRGWYDSPGSTFSTTDHIDGSTQSLRIQFNQGAMQPISNILARHLFTASDAVYLRYWVKYSTNWVGSGKSYHPHEFHFITNEDDQWVGPSATHLTTYVEENFQNGAGAAVLTIQDALNVDMSKIGVDLTNVTENRAVAGCNGDPDGTSSDCYQAGSIYQNGRSWRSGTVYTQTNKSSWHKVEVYFKLNTIANGKGQMNGIAQYWLDGTLVVDRQNVLFRTAAHPNMKFNQFLIAPYIGDGSPVDQTMWIDDLVVMTGKP